MTGVDWFHCIEVDGYITPGLPYQENWEFVAEFLQKHRTLIEGADVLEPGCADGLWTCWLTKLGARHVDASDIADRDQFRLIVQAFGLPATYFPGLLSTCLPAKLQRQYDVVCSLGLLYHVHDPLTTLIMYRRYLREDGQLILETGAIDESAPYLHYTGAGEIYGMEGGNQFLPTMGFLHSALSELGIRIEAEAFRPEGVSDKMGRPVGRTILVGKRTGSVRAHNYPALLEQLDMAGPRFSKEPWYDVVV